MRRCAGMEKIMLEIKNIHKTFNLGTINEKKALNGVTLYLDEGDFVTVIGGNGAGKSTTMKMMTACISTARNPSSPQRRTY